MTSFICRLSLVLLSLFIVTDAVAQRRQRNQPRRPAPARQEKVPPLPVLPDLRSDADVVEGDVVLVANVTAEELVFEAVPDPKVEFVGGPNNKTIWEAQRFNLPDRVEPGVVYRNVGIRLKIISTLPEIERIVSEALGEIPIQPEAPVAEAKAPPAKEAPKQRPDVSARRSNQ